jgi:uncharacterized protein (DUF1778 family)
VAAKKAKRARKTATAKAEPIRRKVVRKTESMRIRISRADKALLERAAAHFALGLSGFILSAAVEKARVALGESATVVATGAPEPMTPPST